jgi:adenosine deaminase
MPTGLILCAMRNQSPSISHTIAELAVAFADRGVVGFDLAGDEIATPQETSEAFQFIRNKNFNITIHAGEAFGVESIWQAVQLCGATASDTVCVWSRTWGLKGQESMRWVRLRISSSTAASRWRCA